MDGVIVAALLESLRSRSSIDRLKAARELSRRPLDHPAREVVRAQAASESDAWVRSALERVLTQGNPAERTDRSVADPLAVDPKPDAVVEEIRQSGMASAANLLLHEVRPIVGTLELRARRDIRDYASSETRKEIDRLQRFLATLGRLADVSRPPQPREFDLTVAIATSLSAAGLDDSRVLSARIDPAVSFGDWDLLEFAFVNAVRNALEAQLPDSSPVVINWGVTDVDSWVSVLDDGIGVPTSADVFAAGFSTKPRDTNQGWGLAIARQAVTAMDGDLSLRPREPRGSAFEIRWPLRRAGA